MGSQGTGTPVNFVCPVARQNQVFDQTMALKFGHRAGYSYPKGHQKIVRTGATRPNTSRKRGTRVDDREHEFICECGRRGWSRLKDILRYPLGCPDGGTCHHECQERGESKCWRVGTCGPLTIAGWGDTWPRRYQ